MKRITGISIVLSLAVLPFWANAQSGISLYHLTNSVSTNSNTNPAFIPNGKVYFGVPVLSGIAVDYNNVVSYNQLVTKDSLGAKYYNLENVLNASGKRNWINMEVDVDVFNIGWRHKGTTAFSVFVRERVGARVFYKEETARLAIEGNQNLLDQNVDLGSTMIDQRWYREYGLGVWKSIPNKGINVGVRVKLLNGMVAMVTDKKFDGTMRTNSFDSRFDFNFQNGTLNSSGYNLFDSPATLQKHIISNSNWGWGLDLGAHWRATEQLSFAASITDIGSITWKVDAQNINLIDTSFQYLGHSFKDGNDIAQTLKDSLINKFDYDSTFHSFKTGLNSKIYLTGIYQLTDKDKIMVTIADHTIQGRARMLYGIGYTRKFGKVLDLSANLVRTPQYGIDLGLAAAVNAGAFQFFIAADKLTRVWNVPNTTAMDLRFGFNFILGRNEMVKDDRSDLNHTWVYDGNKKMEKTDGIYEIIPNRKARPTYEKKTFEQKKVRRLPKKNPYQGD